MSRPAKPLDLTSQHFTQDERTQREQGESAMSPSTELRKTPPLELQGDKRAEAVWRKLRKLYAETSAKIATSFDEGSLIDYCLGVVEVEELIDMRARIKADWETMKEKAVEIPSGADNFIKTWEIVNALAQKVLSYDARIDAKRKLLHSLRQSLYLTPRSRAGAIPEPKPKPEPISKMEQVLDDTLPDELKAKRK